MDRLWHGIEMMRSSWGVLRKDKELMALPLIAGVLILIINLVLGYPVFNMIRDANEGLPPDAELAVPELAYFLGFIISWLTSFVAMFFNAAIVLAANERLSGGNPTIASAVSGASRHLAKIFGWALISTIVILVIGEIVKALGALARRFGWVLETAWKAVTYLTIPALVLEGLGPVDAGYRSKALIKKTWGEGLAGHIGLAALRSVALLFTALLLFMAYQAGIPLIVAVPVAIAASVAQLTLFSALVAIFQTILYRYATGAEVDGFSRSLIAGAFITKDGSQSTRAVRTPSHAGSGTLAAPHLGTLPPIGPITDPRISHDPWDDARYQVESEFQAAPAVDFDEPQDWSKLPDEWTTYDN